MTFTYYIRFIYLLFDKLYFYSFNDMAVNFLKSCLDDRRQAVFLNWTFQQPYLFYKVSGVNIEPNPLCLFVLNKMLSDFI